MPLSSTNPGSNNYCDRYLFDHGCPVQAITAAFGYDERTVRRWEAESGRHCKEVHEQLVEQPRVHEHIQADELRVKLQGVVVWVAMALCAVTRLWLGAEVDTSRKRRLFDRYVKKGTRYVCYGVSFCRVGYGTFALLRVLLRKTRAFSTGVLNPAYIERFYATIGSRLAGFARRTRALFRKPELLKEAVYLIGYTGFCNTL